MTSAISHGILYGTMHKCFSLYLASVSSIALIFFFLFKMF